MKKLLCIGLVLLSGWAMAQSDTVTFKVDMSQYSGSSYTTVNINGTFNSWCGGCNAMTDADNDSIWEISLPLNSGTIEYKFTLDGWTGQENLATGLSCVLTTGPNTNRLLQVSGDTTLPVVCWEACVSCSSVPIVSKSPIDLPITWDDTANVNYTVIDFGGNSSTLTTDPMDPSNLVMRSVKTTGAQTWAGTTLGSALANPIPFVSGSTIMQAVVYAPAAGTPIRLKAEDQNDPTISVETEVNTTVAGWDTLTFDFANQAAGTAAINFANTYDKLSIFYDFNTAGAADTFYVDQVYFGNNSGGGVTKAPIDLPITWDDTTNIDYSVIDFGGNASMLTVDPMDPANLVLRSVKTAGAQTWAGTTLGNALANPIPFVSGSTQMQAVVYAPAAGTPIRLKAEDQNDPAISVETEVMTTVAGWDTLTFDFANQAAGTAAINFANTYDKLSIFYDFNTAGAADTFYVDDVMFGGNTGGGVMKAPIDLPITWDDTTNIDYSVIDFGGNASMLTVDPMDPANLVLRSVKTSGAQTWAGTTLGNSLANPIPFASGSTEIEALVYASAAGIPIRLKAEDQNDPAISVETEVMTTMAGWDTLTFDFSNNAAGTPAINLANTYDKLSIFYDFGTAGAADTFYVDYVGFGVGGGGGGSNKLPIDLPITWDDTVNVDYTVVDFGGNASMLTTDPMDASNLVLRSVKTSGAQTWAGTSLGSSLANPIPFVSGSTVISALVYTPAAGTVVRLKAEDHTDPTITVETEATSTVAGWDTLRFDFANEASGTAAINFANTYDMLSIFYDFNTAGAADTFYVDDVVFGGSGIGLFEMGWSEIQMAPNPSNGQIIISGELGSDNHYQIILSDLSGKQLLKVERNNNEVAERLDLSNYKNGTYLISIIGESGMVTKKLILQH